MSRHHEIEWRDNLQRPQVSWTRPSTCTRTVRSHRKAWLALGVALAGFAVHLAPLPVVVEPWSPNLVHVVGESRWLILENGIATTECSHAGSRTQTDLPHIQHDGQRAGEHFVSTHSDIDITWTQECTQ